MSWITGSSGRYGRVGRNIDSLTLRRVLMSDQRRPSHRAFPAPLVKEARTSEESVKQAMMPQELDRKWSAEDRRETLQ